MLIFLNLTKLNIYDCWKISMSCSGTQVYPTVSWDMRYSRSRWKQVEKFQSLSSLNKMLSHGQDLSEFTEKYLDYKEHDTEAGDALSIKRHFSSVTPEK